jgi:chemotaxis signal transduction protein
MHFLPSLAVQQIGPLPPITRIPASPPELAGVVEAEGAIVPVIDLRKEKSEGLLLVCSYIGEPIGVALEEVIGVGHYDVDPAQSDSIIVGEARARPLDLASLYAKLQSAAPFRA